MSAPQPRPGILELRAYVGGESSVVGVNRVVRLASNENPLGASPQAIAAYTAGAGELHRYPDGTARQLRRAIADAEGLDAERIVCGAGSDELISLLVRAYAGPGDEVLHSAHGFLMYAISSRAAGAKPVAAPETNLTADVDQLLAKVGARTKLLFLANPNNPTGSYLPHAEIERLHAELPESCLLVLDAAYAEYVAARDYDAGAKLVERSSNVIMLRTFSKVHGLASLRLGWAYCPPTVADVLNRVRGPFNVSQAAQDAGVAAVGDRAHVEASARHNAKIRERFGGEVARLGILPAPSAGNFLLLRFPDQEARAAAAALSFLKARGILLRGMEAYGLPRHLRCTLGTEEEMRLVLEALTEFMA